MANERWEPAFVKAQLRLTSLRLGQLQEKKDSQGAISRRDIATLLQQRNVGLARLKAQRLLQEDALGDLLEVLEMHVGQLLEHFNEIYQSTSPTPNVAEAASTIIYAAPHVDSKDLEIVSELLTQRLGPDFARSARGNHDSHVASTALQTITAPPPSAEALDASLENIANDFGVKWSPEPRREEILNTLSEILDPQSSPVVDMVKLRRICCRGIPDEPSWLRPRIWKLFLGILPVIKASWGKEMQQHRESYYGLIKRVLEPFAALPPPSQPPTPLDSVLLDVSKQLSSIPFTLFGELINAPESFESCPLDDSATDEIKVTSARNLDIRLNDLKIQVTTESEMLVTSDIRLERLENGTPEISLSSPAEAQDGPTTLLSFKPRIAGTAHRKHSSALLRLLYLHASINPGNLSPHIPSLLIPLYTVLNQEVVPEDLAHAEADTFWLFEAMVGEFSELEDEEGGNVWIKRFSERLLWADADLSHSLTMKGLDPGLPHYSYRWLAPLLAHTLPLSAIYPVWDALFSCPMRARDSNPKIDHLLDISVAMLIRARAALLRLGKPGRKSPSLWAGETNALPPLSPLRAWELGDAFLEGMSLLQLYPIEAVGGIDRILQTASDLRHRRGEESKLAQKDRLSLGNRLKVTMWKGFTNQVSSPDTSPEESEDELSDGASREDGDDTETPGKTVPVLTSRLATIVWRGITNQTSMGPPPSPRLLPPPSAPHSPPPPTQGIKGSNSEPGLTSRLATTVWRGITNQTSMEPPPSPLSPQSTSMSPSPSPSTQESIDSSPDESSNPKSSLWAYTDKLKDSDAVATFAKVSTNWRAKAMLGSWGSTISSPSSKLPGRSESVSEGSNIKLDEGRRGSLPPIDRSGVYSPPPRPLYFRPPRDSFILPTNETLSSLGPEQSMLYDSGFTDKARSLQSSLAALTRTLPSQPVAKKGPRPLLLSPSTPITSPPNRPISRSAGSTPALERSEWADVMRLKGLRLHRDSQSSVSSLSPSDAFRSAKSSRAEWESDTGVSGRRVPLNRKSVSPMAPGSRIRQGRPISGSSSATSSDHGLLSPPLSTQSDLQSWSCVNVPESPLSTSPHVPKSPTVLQSHKNGVIHVMETVSTDDTGEPSEPRKLTRKKTPPSPHYHTDDSSNSSVVHVPSRSPRLRSKRYTARPPNLSIQENGSRPRAVAERKSSNPNTLAVEWPADDQEIARTPRASSFNVDDDVMFTSANSSRSIRRSRKVSTETQERLRKTSTDGHDTRPHKTSSGQRTRRVSSEHRDMGKTPRESSAEEGDDEGYDDLLSAYESEEQISSTR
ncbi:hypothetical protein D9615_001614 [Tricholomella constricta]|uniref:Rab-GAP TBC domain-containing protein n=1 Tax=Tricholomella constricta TaxID=117010 RepID=A0A8H5HPI3_9AGAR|nr:hypothetical protein D9615_001614 [Tricholomella constricta]